MDRADLARWQAEALHIAVGMIKRKYELELMDDIAPLDEACLHDRIKDAIDDATYKLWLELDPYKPSDTAGTRADKAWELWREATS
jgi:hypothetical protein